MYLTPPQPRQVVQAHGRRYAHAFDDATLWDISKSTPANNHTAVLQAAIDAAPDRSTLVIPYGVWNFDNLVITKNIILDWSWSYLIVDPTPDGVTTGNPAIWFKGAVSLFSNITAMTGANNTLTAAAPSGFSAKDWCLIGDSKIIRAWDDANADGVADAGSSSNSTGYQGRYELNRISSLVGGAFTLERTTEWAYDTSAFIKKITPLVKVGCINISGMTEVDPGGVFSGSDIQQAPHLIKFDYCIDPFVEGCTFGNYNLQAINFDTCHKPRARDCVAYDPYRPTTGGHGYHLRFNRCHDGLAQRMTSYRVRHAVDHTQAYQCGSLDCLSVDTIVSSYAYHGLQEKRCYSRNDTHTAAPGYSSVGWAIGNPSFGASYDTTLDEPRFTGVGTAVNVGYTSNNTHINNPRIKGQVPLGSSDSFRGVMHTTGATNTYVNGGYIDGSEVYVNGCDLITARNNVIASDTIAVKPDGLYVKGATLVGTIGDQVTTVYHINVAQCTTTVIQNNVFVYPANGNQCCALIYSATNNNLVLENNTIQGAAGKYGYQVNVAPTQQYRVVGNSSSVAFAVTYMVLTASTLLVENDNAPDVVQTLTFAATIATDASYNVSFGRASQKTRFKVTLTGNATLGNLTTTPLRDGREYRWYVTQDATGGRTLAYQSQFKFEGGAPTLSTAANAVDIIVGVWDSVASCFYCRLSKGQA